MLIPVWNPPHQLIDESGTSNNKADIDLPSPQLVDTKNKSEIGIDVGSESKMKILVIILLIVMNYSR